MLADVFALQPLVLGIVFGSTGLWKLFGPRSPALATRSALAVLVSPRVARAVYRVVGGGEISLAIVLLVAPEWTWTTRVAAGLAASFVSYLLISMRIAPGRPCACFGGREMPVSWRTVGRAGSICAFSALGWPAHGSWLATLVADPTYIGLVAAQLLFLVAMSPELTPLRSLGSPRLVSEPDRPAAEVDCGTVSVPMTETLKQLHASPVYADLSGLLRSEAVEHWREGCWRFLSFDAKYNGRPATAVFAVPISYQPHRIRVALVDEIDRAVLLEKDASHTQFQSGPLA